MWSRSCGFSVRGSRLDRARGRLGPFPSAPADLFVFRSEPPSGDTIHGDGACLGCASSAKNFTASRCIRAGSRRASCGSDPAPASELQGVGAAQTGVTPRNISIVSALAVAWTVFFSRSLSAGSAGVAVRPRRGAVEGPAPLEAKITGAHPGARCTHRLQVPLRTDLVSGRGPHPAGR
jgi:hypothetical protein